MTPVSAIVGGKINFKLKVRLIHMLRIPNFNKPAENQVIPQIGISSTLIDISFLMLESN
jgi:hypothetical protein